MAFGSDPGLSGRVACLRSDDTAGAPEAVLVEARLRTGKASVELAQRSGVWELSIPAQRSRVLLRPQLRSIVIQTSKTRRTISMDRRSDLKALGARLRKDPVYVSRSFAFFVAVVQKMIELEIEHRIRFRVLDEVIESRTTFRGAVLASGSKKPGHAGWGGVEVPSFVECMLDCEKDVDWWEVWMRAYCLVHCGIKSGTGGGALYPD